MSLYEAIQVVDERVHALARALCYVRYGDWRYDSSDRKYEEFYAQATALLEALTCQSNGDVAEG